MTYEVRKNNKRISARVVNKTEGNDHKILVPYTTVMRNSAQQKI